MAIPLFLGQERFLISSLEVLSRVGKQKSVNVAAPAVTGSESNLVKPSTSRRDSLSKITINTFDFTTCAADRASLFVANAFLY
jgi:hypothetical protein